MSNLKIYNLDAVGDSIQFGKTGGFARYLPGYNSFLFKQSDNTSTAVVNAAGFTAINGDISVSDVTKSIGIDDATISYDSSHVLKFDGQAAVIVPSGINDERPAVPKVGMLRMNTESIPYLETYNGTQWSSVTNISAAGSNTQIQYNLNGQLGASSRFSLSFNEGQATSTLNIGDPTSFTGTASTSSIAFINGGSSVDGKQGTNLKIRGGDNSGTGNGGSVTITGGYAIASGTYAGSVALIGGESSVGNHGHVLVYTMNSSGGTDERLRIAGGSGAWGLNGENYGSAGQVLTSNGYDAPPTWTNIAGVAKQNFAFNSNPTIYLCVVPAGGVILSISIVINTPFNDPATTITVGDAAVPDRLFAAVDNLPGTAGSYTVYPNYVYGPASQVIISLTGSSSVGSGIVTISYE